MNNSVNNNLNSFINKGFDKRAAFRAERDSKVQTYGKKSYVGKLLNLFASDANSGTSSYWLEVTE